MGDNRATIKIEFSMYGFTEKADMWINWFPLDEGEYAVDRRVLEFFENAAEKMWYQKVEDELQRKLEREREIAKADWTDGTWVPPSLKW